MRNRCNGGVLLQTPLLGADNKVYAVAQGAMSVGGFSAGARRCRVARRSQKIIPRPGEIVDGALVEREIPTTIVRDKTIELLLREPGFTSAALMATAINKVFTNSAHAVDTTSVQVQMPARHGGRRLDFIARLENIEVDADTPPRASSSTSAPARLWRPRASTSRVARWLTATSPSTVASTLDVSQPNAFSRPGPDGGNAAHETPR